MLLEMDNPSDPGVVAERLRTAALTARQLTVYMAGQLLLHPDRQTLQVPLASSPRGGADRAALGWHSLVSRLGRRAPGSTTVIVDLVADDAAWRRVRGHGLFAASAVRLFGVVRPPPRRRTRTVPHYLVALAAAATEGTRVSLPELHRRAATSLPPGERVLLAHEPLRLRDTRRSDGHGSPHVPIMSSASVGAPAAVGEAESAAAPPEPSSPILQNDMWNMDTVLPHPAILAAAEAGRHDEAAAAAGIWEQAALRTHGPGSPQAVHWLEVRAELARMAGKPSLSCQLWSAAARVRMDSDQPSDHPEVEAAVDRAHHQFEHITDAAQAQRLGQDLLALRRRVPGRQAGAVDGLARRVAS
ncbi:hypothetical protein OKJ48_22540 [Streptomyces kunmingensis]|uniref:Uncharacterized protein n=2 Tax=Streptomyces kunmingensis TaxID=68225 RepID=A0ABU6CEV8_9ACTN|nr:hypothetical protein [Streptomyces kunmingensis]MEB3963004.1 hypothetical protein [Streptomyces kunmingensis]